MQREVLHVDLGYSFSLPTRGLHACSRLFLFYNYMCNQMVARGNGLGNCLDLNKTRVKLFPNFMIILSNIMGDEIVSNRDF